MVAKVHVSEKEKFKKDVRLQAAGEIIPLKGSIPGRATSKGSDANVTVTARDSVHRTKLILKTKLAEGGRRRGFLYEYSRVGCKNISRRETY